MSRGVLCGLLCFLLITGSCSKDELVEPIDLELEKAEAILFAEQILDLVNQHRESIGKLELTRNVTADDLAAAHTNYMISQGEISHTDFISRLRSLQDEENADAAAENVAAGYDSAEAVMEGWIGSSGHRTNIEGNFTHIGIAAGKDSNGKYYYTQLFYR